MNTNSFQENSNVPDPELRLLSDSNALKNILDRISDGFAVLDSNWINIYTNTVACKLLNRDPKDLIGNSFWDNYPDMKGTEVETSLRFAMEKKQQVELEYFYEVLGRWFQNEFCPSENGITIIFRDITEKKRSEEKLKFALSQLENVYETLELSFWGIDLANHKTLYVSPGTEKIYEHTTDYLNEHPDFWFTSVFKEDMQNLSGILEKVNHGKTASVEFRRVFQEGTERWFETRISPTLDCHGKLTRIDGITADITKRKSDEFKILQSEALLSESQRIAKIGSWELDLQKNELQWSKETFRIFEMDPKNFKASYEAFLDLVHPTERDFVNSTYTRSVQEKTPYEITHRLLFPDGRIKHVQERAETIYSPDGEPIRSLGTVQDITERIQAEMLIQKKDQQIREISSSMPSVVFQVALDHSGKQLCNFVGDNIYTLTGVTPEEIYHEFTKFSSQIHPEDAVRAKHEVAESVKSPGYFSSSFRLVDARNGEIKWVISNAFTSLQPDGMFVMNGTITDYTEVKNAEDELKRSNRELRKLMTYLQSVREEERTKIARDLHDELGQQLTVLKLDAAWLFKKMPEGEQAMQTKVLDMIALIDETVKSIRRISSELHPGILDDLGLEEALQWQCREFEKRTGIRCRLESVSEKLNFNKDLSTQVFRICQEALTNVARHAQATEVVARFEQTNENLFFQVSDNGIGFNSADIGSKHTLGLLGMKERVSGLGGSLHIESGIGKGTTILLQLPLQFAASGSLAKG